MSEIPLVSIITPTFNRESYLKECIDSVLMQNFEDWEMIIIDDGSTDETKQLVSNYSQKDPRITYLYQKQSGVSEARNHGISKARGRYITLLDSDDKYLPGALKTLVTAINTAPKKVKLVYGDFIIINDQDEILKEVTTTAPQQRPELYYQFLISDGNPIVPSTTIIDRKAIVEVGLFNTSFTSCEDVELWSRLIAYYDISKINQQITVYRRHEDQLTAKHGLRRYNRDRHAFQFFKRIPITEWFPNTHSDLEVAKALSALAQEMLRRRYPSIDTALYLLRLAQQKQYDPQREIFINSCEAQTPALLQKQFHSERRVDTTLT